MTRNTIAVLCCLGMFTLGCGGATPEPETANDAVEHASSTPMASNTGTDAEEGPAIASDPETTEEVIETSDPLD